MSSNQLTGTIPSQLQLPSLLLSGTLFLASNQLCYNVNYTSWATTADYTANSFCKAANCQYYGSTCANPCSCNVTSQACSSGVNGNGSCSCLTGFTGVNCTVCGIGYFGPNCVPGIMLPHDLPEALRSSLVIHMMSNCPLLPLFFFFFF